MADNTVNPELAYYSDHLEKRTKRGETHFDSFWKNTQFVAGGAIVGSLTILKDLTIALPTGLQIGLKISWLLLAAAIACSLFASFCSAHGTKSEVCDLQDHWDQNETLKDYKDSPKTKGWRKWEFGFELVSPIALFVGLILMAIVLSSVPLQGPQLTPVAGAKSAP